MGVEIRVAKDMIVLDVVPEVRSRGQEVILLCRSRRSKDMSDHEHGRLLIT